MQSRGAQREGTNHLWKLAVLLGFIAISASLGAQEPEVKDGANALRRPANLIFAGIKGRVVALDRGTGKIVWSTHLSGGDFVNVVLSGGDLFASTKGEVFSIEPATGQIRWHNPLPGYGRGLMTLAASGVLENQTAAIMELRHLMEEQAAAAQPK